MAYSRSQKLTPEEKRLQDLKTQLYGKEEPHIQPKPKASSAFRFEAKNNGLIQPQTSPISKTSYLKKDLLKTGVLSVIILGAQALLYLSLHRGLLSFTKP